MNIQLLNGDCLDKLKELEENSIDSIVTDPPYGLSFMGKKWDYDVPSTEIWEECMRVLKPGGHLLSFAGSRTYHRMAVRIEDAGFEIRDQIMWVYGSGFPKSHNIGHKIDEYKGWGTALKPAHEPIVLARKPLIGTVADNVLEYGVGGLNIDGCRVGNETMVNQPAGDNDVYNTSWKGTKIEPTITEGRFPANIIFDEEAGKILDEQSGKITGGHWPHTKTTGFGEFGGGTNEYYGVGPKDKETGGASRFFYCPKASKKDRDEGCDGLEDKKTIRHIRQNEGRTDAGKMESSIPRKNHHPTVKPTELMKYLIRLVTPKGGVVLDPFMGSGSTGKAAVLEGMNFVGIEREEEYYLIAQQRIEHSNNKTNHTKWFE